MNIFYLDESPILCAQYLCDKHCVKMVLESAQLLSTAHRVAQSPVADYVYRAAYVNHPCSRWTRESTGNYEWLFDLFVEQLKEYTHRYGKTHATTKFIPYLERIPEIKRDKFTTPPQCMPDKYKQSNTIEAYRQYYLGEKLHFAKWAKNRNKPYWIGEI